MNRQGPNKTICFRVDSSLEIGSGHVMRCLTLARQLQAAGAEVHFICRDWDGNIGAIIQDQGYPLRVLPKLTETYHAKVHPWLGVSSLEDAHETAAVVEKMGKPYLMIVDHYGIDEVWERHIRSYVEKVMVIDDLANRRHDCDLLLDQNFYDDMNHRYHELVPSRAALFLGPSFALLRDEFYRMKDICRSRDGNVNKVLVFFGGSDATNETEKTIHALLQLGLRDLEIDVVVGKANPHAADVQKLCASHPGFRFIQQANHMAELMHRADLAIGAGGTANWERMILGLPTLAMILADNQKQVVEALARHDVIINLGWNHKLTAFDLAEKIAWILERPFLLAEMAKKSEMLMKANEEGRLVPYLMGVSDLA